MDRSRRQPKKKSQGIVIRERGKETAQPDSPRSAKKKKKEAVRKRVDQRIERLRLDSLQNRYYLSDGESSDSEPDNSPDSDDSVIPYHSRRVYITVSNTKLNYLKQWYTAKISSTRSLKKMESNLIIEPLFSFFKFPANPGSATAFLGSVSYTIAGSSSSMGCGVFPTSTVTCLDTEPKSVFDMLTMPDLERPRSGAVAVGYKGCLFIFGGIHAHSDATETERENDMVYWTELFDPTRHDYLTLSVPLGHQLSDIDRNFTAVALEEEDKILLIGIKAERLHKLYYYYPEKDHWVLVHASVPRVDERTFEAAVVPRINRRVGFDGVPRKRRTGLQSKKRLKIKISNAVRVGKMVYWYYLGVYAYDIEEGWVAFAQIEGLENAGVRMAGDPDGSTNEELIENFLISLMKGSATNTRNPALLSIVTLHMSSIVQFTKFMVRKNEDHSIRAYYVDEESFLLDPCSQILSVNVRDWRDHPPPSDKEEEEDQGVKTSEEATKEVGSRDGQDQAKMMNIIDSNKDMMDKEAVPECTSKRISFDLNVTAEDITDDQTVPQGTQEVVPQGTQEVVPPQGTKEVVPPQGAKEVVPQAPMEVVPQAPMEVAPQAPMEVVPDQEKRRHIIRFKLNNRERGKGSK